MPTGGENCVPRDTDDTSWFHQIAATSFAPRAIGAGPELTFPGGGTETKLPTPAMVSKKTVPLQQ